MSQNHGKLCHMPESVKIEYIDIYIICVGDTPCLYLIACLARRLADIGQPKEQNDSGSNC